MSTRVLMIRETRKPSELGISIHAPADIVDAIRGKSGMKYDLDASVRYAEEVIRGIQGNDEATGRCFIMDVVAHTHRDIGEAVRYSDVQSAIEYSYGMTIIQVFPKHLMIVVGTVDDLVDLYNLPMDAELGAWRQYDRDGTRIMRHEEDDDNQWM